MQVVVEDDTDGEALVQLNSVMFNYIQFCLVTLSSFQLHSVLFSYIQLCSVACSSDQLHAVPFNSVQFIQLTAQLETIKLSELMEGTYLPCGR